MESKRELFLEDYKARKNKYLSRKLTEDVDEEIEEEEIEPEVAKTVTLSLVGDLIKRLWEQIDVINSDIVQLNVNGDDSMVPVLSEILSDTYMHIGQLEKLLEGPVPEAENLDAGREAAEDIPEEDEEDFPNPGPNPGPDPRPDKDWDSDDLEDYPDDIE